MIHIVSLRKAVLAGIVAAFAWELAIRIIQFGGIALFDIVQHLGTLAFPAGPVLAWWMTGMVIHATVGAIWAIFSAYFFWSTFDWPPAFQGLAFSLLPTFIPLFISYPHPPIMPFLLSPALF